MIWPSLTWDLELWEQTVARLLRRGVDKTVKIWRLVVPKTRDGAVLRSIQGKKKAQDFLKDELSYYRQQYERQKQR